MEPLAEATDIKANPLPQIIIADPLTYVWRLDAEIERLRELIGEKTAERELALKYAIDNNVQEDSVCKLNIERTVRKSRTLNVDRFREVFPEEYEMACDIERKDVAERLARIGERINLTLVDKLVKKPRLEAAQGVITVKESETLSYQVVRK